MIHRLFRVMEMMATPPENRNVVWLDTTTHKLKIYENGEWTIYYPEGCILLSPIDLTEEEKSTIRKNIGVDVIDTKDLADGSVTTEKIANDAVTYNKLANNALGTVIEYGASAATVASKLNIYRNQNRRLGLYVYDASLGMIPAINQTGEIIRAVSVIKSSGVGYVDIYILIFDGTKWSRQSYLEVGRIPGDGSVTTPKIADNAVSGIKICDGAVTTAKLAKQSVTFDKLYDRLKFRDGNGNTFEDYTAFSSAINSLSKSCGYSHFGARCMNNLFGKETYGNFFGYGCIGNKFSDSVQNNYFGNSFTSNTLRYSQMHGNVFGSNCGENIFEEEFRYNTVGNNVLYNEIGQACWNNVIGNQVRWCKFGFLMNCEIGSGVEHVILQHNGNFNKRLCNVHVLTGVKGSNSNPLTITFDDKYLAQDRTLIVTTKRTDGNPSTAADIVMYYADEVLYGEVTSDKLALGARNAYNFHFDKNIGIEKEAYKVIGKLPSASQMDTPYKVDFVLVGESSRWNVLYAGLAPWGPDMKNSLEVSAISQDGLRNLNLHIIQEELTDTGFGGHRYKVDYTITPVILGSTNIANNAITSEKIADSVSLTNDDIDNAIK